MVGVDIAELHKKSACVTEENMIAEDHTKIDPVIKCLSMLSICARCFPQLANTDDRLMHPLLYYYHIEPL